MRKILLLVIFLAVGCWPVKPQDAQTKFRLFKIAACNIYDADGKLLPAAQQIYDQDYKPLGLTVKDFEEKFCHDFDSIPFLIKKVHKDSSWYSPSPSGDKAGWLIAYAFTDACVSSLETQIELTQAISRSLRLWLAQLKPPLASEAIVDNFYYREVAIIDKGGISDRYEFDLSDLNGQQPHLKFVFQCDADQHLGSYFHPDKFYVHMNYRKASETRESLLLCGTDYVQASSCESAGYSSGGYSLVTLVHEIGHAFALGDTYYDRTGVKDGQPVSVMSNYGAFYATDNSLALKERLVLNEDDARGIKFIYSHIHKGTPIDSCLSSDYEYVSYTFDAGLISLGDCRPQYPLIFRLKQAWVQEHNHSNLQQAAIIIAASVYNLSGGTASQATSVAAGFNNRQSMLAAEKANAQDETGNSGLHYAVLHGAQSQQLRTKWLELLSVLLQLNDCSPQQRISCLEINAKNHEGKTALHIAAEQSYTDAVAKLLARGADKHSRDHVAKTALDYAQLPAVRKLLQ